MDDVSAKTKDTAVELTSADITQYEEEGYLVVRDALDATELNRFDKAFRTHLDELLSLIHI